MSEIAEKCAGCGGDILAGGKIYNRGTLSRGIFDPHTSSPPYCSDACARGASDVRCSGCGTIFSAAYAKNRFHNVHGEEMCPRCSLTPCAICEKAQSESHDGHTFEAFQPEIAMRELRFYDTFGFSGLRYTVKWPNGRRISLSAEGSVYDWPPPADLPETLDTNPSSPGFNRKKCAHGWKIGADDLPDACIALIMAELAKECTATVAFSARGIGR